MTPIKKAHRASCSLILLAALVLAFPGGASAGEVRVRAGLPSIHSHETSTTTVSNGSRVTFYNGNSWSSVGRYNGGWAPETAWRPNNPPVNCRVVGVRDGLGRVTYYCGDVRNYLPYGQDWRRQTYRHDRHDHDDGVVCTFKGANRTCYVPQGAWILEDHGNRRQHDCQTVYKTVTDQFGRPEKLAATMCFNGRGEGYIRDGSLRFVR